MTGKTLDELLALKDRAPRPLTYCLCGSTGRAAQAFRSESLRLTLTGYKVLSIGANTGDADLGITEEQKIQLDILHLFKIEDADVVLILNVGGYVGESTRRELEYARRLGKRIEFLEQDYLLKWKIRGERAHSLSFMSTEDQALRQFSEHEALLFPLDGAISVELFIKGHNVPHRQMLFTPGRRGQKQQEVKV